jgi:hypothetical protein
MIYSFLILIKAPAGSSKASLIYTALAVEKKLARRKKKKKKEGGLQTKVCIYTLSSRREFDL